MTKEQSGRRSFLHTASIGSLLALAIPELILTSFAEEKAPRLKLSDKEVILFQGDSITDAGRDKKSTAFNKAPALGSGYAFMASADLLRKSPDKDLKIYNKGISGNKVPQLRDRWNADTLDLNPSIISILIGVNDYWHKSRGQYDGTVETYRRDYIQLMQLTREKLPSARFIIGEPFALLGKAVDKSWFPALQGYQEASREIAASFNAVFIPYQRVFNKAAELAPASYWSEDGVHPTIAGARLMADAWLEAVKA